MGRTPRINREAGRDHWSFCYSVVLAGGGVRGGRVYGSSDRTASYPATNPVSPADLAATIYHCLGIDPHTHLAHQQARPLAAGPAFCGGGPGARRRGRPGPPPPPKTREGGFPFPRHRGGRRPGWALRAGRRPNPPPFLGLGEETGLPWPGFLGGVSCRGDPCR